MVRVLRFASRGALHALNSGFRKEALPGSALLSHAGQQDAVSAGEGAVVVAGAQQLDADGCVAPPKKDGREVK